MKDIICVFLGGGSGALMRWFLRSFIKTFEVPTWAGTLVVNLLGVGALAYFLKYGREYEVSTSLDMAFRVGLVASFTTFSTFILEAATSLREGKMLEAGLILGLNIFLGIIIGYGIIR